MRGKKGVFGYLSGIAKSPRSASHDWFDPGRLFVRGDEVLPDDQEERPRYLIGRVLVIIVCLILASRLTHLQITQGSENRFLAEGNRIRRQITVAPRGAILDRTGQSLVINEAGYSLDIVPSDLPRDRAERRQLLEEVAVASGVPVEAIQAQIDKVGLLAIDPVTIQSNVPRETALVYKLKFPHALGVRVSFVPSRKYDSTPGLGHLLGYTSRMNDRDIAKHPDYHPSSPIGRAGLEASYDAYLRGNEGVNEIEVNAQGRYQRSMQNLPPKEGKTLHLTLDKGLQAEMAAALQEAMEKSQFKQSVGVAIDVKTGGILASVSFPHYDNNAFANGIKADEYDRLTNDPDRPLIDRAIDGLFAPGSTIKPFVAAAALQEKTITSTTRLDTSAGVIEIGPWQFPDWKKHGVTDVKQALAESNNIFFYALGGGWDKVPGLGVERLKRYLQLFGFGESPKVDYTFGQSGLIPDVDWKKRVKKESWYIGDTYHMSIGQGDVLVTPIQLVRAVAAIANGGTMVSPHIVESLEDPDSGRLEALAFPSHQLPLDSSVIEAVREGMYLTVNSDTGSARTLRSLPFSSAGKTGTAQFDIDEKTNAWYVGFAPYESPEIAVAIVVKGGAGNELAVPVAGRVFDYYMSHR